MYVQTRHNIGFMVVDRIAVSEHIALGGGKGKYLLGKNLKEDEELLLLKPLTYMNLSGIPLSDARETFGVDLDNLLVVLDDVNLAFGQLRLRRGGSDGGHNGLASVIYHLESEEFPRLRIGIGKPDDGTPLSEFVLLDFSNEEMEMVPGIIESASACIEVWRREGIEAAMNMANRRMQ
jgi:PTH1 family peptidyl-tRNA hydrolase